MFQILNNLTHRRPFNSSTEVRITYTCTQRCRQCVIPFKNTHTMTLDEFKGVMATLREYGAYVGFISGGETTMVKELPDMMIEAGKTFKYAATLVTGLYNKPERIEPAVKVCLERGMHVQTSFDGLGEIGDDLRGCKDYAETVTDRMKMITDMRRSIQKKSKKRSLLYANTVISNKNIDQIPDILAHVKSLGWRSTIGLYHTLTFSTRYDDDMVIQPGERLDKLIKFLTGNPDIMNLESFVKGIAPYIENPKLGWCPFVESPYLSTRTTIMENGDVHLCKGNPIGNVFRESLKSIFDGYEYRQRLEEYKKCDGCWTTCYTQRYLMVRPKSVTEARANVAKLRSARHVEI
ncbi:MAG: radical SAM protein [Bacteroidetes bacterium]|nr:radical SAM protein [Bacteroidota bacterium]